MGLTEERRKEWRTTAYWIKDQFVGREFIGPIPPVIPAARGGPIEDAADAVVALDAALAEVERERDEYKNMAGQFGAQASEVMGKWNKALLALNRIAGHTDEGGPHVEQDELIRLAESRLRALEEENGRLRTENYADLLDQMDEAWGGAPEIGRAEINAFLESRFVHKPTARLRERMRKLEEENARLRAVLQAIFDWEFGGARPDEHRVIPRQMYDAAFSLLGGGEE